MANFSDTDKRLASGENRKEAGSPAPKRGRLPERDELPVSELNKVSGGVWMIGVRGDNRR
jgi:hypothetical protein